MRRVRKPRIRIRTIPAFLPGKVATMKNAISTFRRHRIYHVLAVFMLAGLLADYSADAATAWSDEVSVTTPRDNTSPDAPTGLSINQGNLSLILDWTDNTEDDICRYNIYRNTSPGVSTSGSPLATTSQSNYTDEGLSIDQRYYYVVTATDLSDCQNPPLADPNPESAASDEANEIVIEIPFDGTDVGGAAPAGSFLGDGCPMTVVGGGGDIWGSSDQFYYVYQPATGDSEMQTKILSQQNTNDWAKAGIMFRETLDANAMHAFMAITPGNGVAFQRRLSTSGTSENTQTTAAVPLCVKLARQGNLFIGYISTNDGGTWTEVDSVTIGMGANYYVGYAITSHAQGTGCTVDFDCCGQPCPDKVPAAPGTLVITDSSATTCDLSWVDNAGNDCDQADDFIVQRSTDGGIYQAIAGVTGTSYADSELAYNLSYNYRVYASNSFGNSDASNVVNLPTRSPNPPAAPTGLAATADADKITLSWNANTETDPPILYYIIYRSTDESGSYIAVAIAFGGSNIVDSNVLNDNTYYYMVKAVNDYPQQSDYSTIVWATPHIPDTPTAPTNLNAAVANYQQISLSWTDLSNNEDGFKIIRNNVETDMVGENITTYLDTGLAPATTYNYKVVAYNVDGNSPEPNPTASATTDTLPIPEPPSDLIAEPNSGTQIDISWADNSLTDDHVEIEREGEIIMTVPSEISSYSDTGLTECWIYGYRVRACNVAGCSDWSNEATAQTTCNPIELWIDDADPAITYTGNWSPQTGWGGRYETTIHESNDLGTPATAQFTFTGTKVQLIGDMQQWGGTVDVYLDDQLELSDVSFHDANGQLYQQVIFTIDNLTNTEHTIRIEKTDGDWIYVDAFVIIHY